MVEISIVIPAYNEEGSIGKTLSGIIKSVKLKNYEILVCNDHSNDKTVEIVNSFAEKHNHVRLISNTDNRGFGNVLRFGYKRAKGRYIVTVMGDLCDDPKTIKQMYKKILQGYDVVIGSRYIKGGGKRNVHTKFQSASSRLMGLIGYYILRINSHDITNPFRMVKKSALKSIKLTSNTYDISIEMLIKLHRKGYSITEVPSVWTDRTAGTSKFNILKQSIKYSRWIFKK